MSMLDTEGRLQGQLGQPLAYTHAQICEGIRGQPSDPIFLQTSAYIAVVIGTTATFLVSNFTRKNQFRRIYAFKFVAFVRHIHVAVQPKDNKKVDLH